MKEQEIMRIRLEELEPNWWNPNQMSDRMLKKLKANIREFGYLQPLVVAELDGKKVIVDGEHRWKAMMEEGIKEAEVVLLRGYTEAELKLLTINLNKLRGEFQPYELARLISELDDRLKNFEDYVALEKEDLRDLKELLAEPTEKVKELREELEKEEDERPIIYRFIVDGEEYVFVVAGRVEKTTVEKALKLSKGVDDNHKFYNICYVFVQLMEKAKENEP